MNLKTNPYDSWFISMCVKLPGLFNSYQLDKPVGQISYSDFRQSQEEHGQACEKSWRFKVKIQNP